ncbi:hypothetical protein [Micromonospora sp. CA-111912]|uniref:hypothetical protein n=1 Tax=Micromonospora sp. CA-111912 TaxID=3239955 RepID=UPI003D8CC2E1
MEITDIIATTCAPLAVFGGLAWRDARLWRAHDKARKLAEDTTRDEERARRSVGVRHERALNRALDLLHEIKIIACRVVTREELLTAARMDHLDLKKHLNGLAVLASTLPTPVNESLCRCHPAGVANLAEALLATPFPDEAANLDVSPSPLRPEAKAALAGLDQYDVANALVTAIDSAESLVRDHLPL